MGGTILIIDDEPATRDLFGRLIEIVGHAPLEASDGQEGIEKVRTEHPDLVICDLRMPGMDGLDVLSWIHEHDPDLPVIMVSGAGTMNDAVEALKRGAWDYVTKPILDVTLLYSAVTRGMERSRHLKQNREHQARLEQLNRELEEALGQLRTDQEAGRQIQLQLLPADAQLFGSYRFSRRLFPSLFLSGDFIDYFAIDDSHVGFYMADVSGHGAASAFVTVMVKTLVGQYRDSYTHDGDQTILDPAATLECIDDDLKRLNLDKHLTMLYGQLDRREHVLCFGNGGHYPYPALCTPEESLTLEMPGCALGLLPDATFQNETMKFPEDARLLLLSDGVLELLPQDSLREKNAELCRVAAQPELDADVLVDAFGINAGAKLLDDVAILLIEREDS